MPKKIKHKIEAEGGELIQSNQPIKIKRGGMAVPLGNGFSLLKGRKHSQGGIDIDLQGDAKIWSSVPFLSGLSPAERVLDGENPDKVFAQQESYKDIYGIKDDGTKKRFGGEDEKYIPLVYKDVPQNNNIANMSFSPIRKALKKYTSDVLSDSRIFLDKKSRNDLDVMDEFTKRLFIDPNDGSVYRSDDRLTPEVIRFANLKEINKDSAITANRKKLDYIGGDAYTARKSFFNRIPKSKQFIINTAKKYNISPNLLLHRIAKEGAIDYFMKEYNYFSTKDKQIHIDDDFLSKGSDGFYLYGLDDAGTLLKENKIHLKDSINWWHEENKNEKGRYVNSATGKTNYDNIILKAATMEYIKNELLKRNDIPKDKIDIYTNAAYNLGLYHNDLTNKEWIEKNYAIPTYTENKKRFGGEGEEDEDSITKGQQTRIAQALEKSRTRTLPKIPYIEKDVITKTSEKNWLNNAKSDLDEYIEKEKEYKKHSQFIDGVKSPTLKSIYKKILNEHFHTQAEDINGVYKDHLIDNYNNAVTENNKKLMPGASCIYTTLDNYDIKNPTPSNIEFKRNPRKYGFMQIPNDSIQSGDIVQENFGGIPVHAMMFDGYDKNGEMLFNYSKGGDDEYSIVKKGHYPMEEAPSVYRFIGQSQDSINWNKKQMGGDINKNGLIYNLNGNVVQGLGYIPSTGRRQKAKFGKWIANSFKSIGKGISNTYNNIKDYAKINPDKFNDYLSAGINTAGAVGSYLINENMLDNMSLPQTPISRQIIKLKTNYNINPQLDAAREAENRMINDINNNTSSSNVALARINQARFANMLNTNTLYGNKENVETELINQDRQNQQTVLNSNIDSYNQYTKELIAAQNQINEARSENLISGINNIAQGFQDIISRREQRKQDNNTKWLHMISAPNAPEIPADFWNWNEDKKMQWWKNKDKGVFGNDGVFYTNEDINKMSRIERKRLGL